MRVLYIEDSAMDADLARLTLARTAPEIKLEVASTLREGLERLDDKGNVYDLLLTDLSLPDGSGLEALTRAREQRLPMAVVILTGSGDQDSEEDAIKASADDYLDKRDDYLERLKRTLRDELER